MSEWRIHTDATAKMGRMAIGAVLIAPDGTKHTLAQLQPGHGDCNEAEALALVAALEHARSLGARSLQVLSDSTVVIAHTTGKEETKIPRLKQVYEQARTLLATFDHVTLQWVPRRRNTEADTLARSALGLPPKLPK